MRGLNEALCHLDAVLSLLDPDDDPKTIRSKRRYDRAKLFGGGELTKLILDALRRSERTLTTPEVIKAVAVELNLGTDIPAGVKARVRAGLRYLRKVRNSVVKEGERATAIWRLK